MQPVTKAEFNDFVDQLNKLINGLIVQMDQRFDYIDRRFDKVDNRFKQLESKFSKLETKFDKLETRFTHMEARFEDLSNDVRIVRIGVIDSVRRSEFVELENRITALEKRIG